MFRITCAAALALVGIIALASNKVTPVTDCYKIQTVCVDGMKFAVAYNSDGPHAVSLTQILDKNGKPKECTKPYEEE